jgi:hypothetical protein
VVAVAVAAVAVAAVAAAAVAAVVGNYFVLMAQTVIRRS